MPLVLPPPRTNISFKAHIIVLPRSMTVRVYAHNLHTTQHNTLNNGEHKSRRCMGGTGTVDAQPHGRRQPTDTDAATGHTGTCVFVAPLPLRVPRRWHHGRHHGRLSHHHRRTYRRHHVLVWRRG